MKMTVELQDLEKDFQARQAEATDQPKSLWQEVYDIGEEFVEFFEQEIGARERRGSKASSDKDRYMPVKIPSFACIEIFLLELIIP